MRVIFVSHFYQLDLLGFPEIYVFTCGHVQEVRIFLYQSLTSLIMLYPFKIVFSYWFLSVQFLLFLEFAAYKKKSLLFCSVTVQNISVALKKREREEKKRLLEKKLICFCCRKLNKGKLDQINSELAQIQYSDYWVLIKLDINFGIHWYRLHRVSISGLIRPDS